MSCIAILFANIGPYHLARISAAASCVSDFGFDILGLELARVEEEYAWKIDTNNLPFPLVTINKTSALEHQNPLSLMFGLWHRFNEQQPSLVCISGYARPTMLVALAWCLWHRKPAILMSETTFADFPRRIWRELPKSWIVKQFSAALVGGKPQARYLQSLGLSEKAIFFGYDVVNNADFHPTAISKRASPLTGAYFLAINRFVSKKNLSFLLDCYSQYRNLAKEHIWDLVLCGDGELRSHIEQQITSLGLEQYVHLPGFLQQEQLLSYFAHAKCFIHASIKEQWGLVVNEAMAAGLPVLVSNRCGCFEDLVLEGVNGFGFDPENVEELANLMVKVSSGDIDLESMGKASLEHIQNFSPEHFAKGLMQAVEYAIAHS